MQLAKHAVSPPFLGPEVLDFSILLALGCNCPGQHYLQARSQKGAAAVFESCDSILDIFTLSCVAVTRLFVNELRDVAFLQFSHEHECWVRD